MQAAQQSAFLVLLAHLDARLLEDLEPGVCQGLPHAHPLLLLVDEQVGHEVLRLAGDVLPQLEVEVDVAHLDTLQRLAVVLGSDGKETRVYFKSLQKQFGFDSPDGRTASTDADV